MTFTALRKIKETVNRINEYNKEADAHLRLTSMFLDGKWSTTIKYGILHKEDIILIIEVCRYLKLNILFGSSGIYIE